MLKNSSKQLPEGIKFRLSVYATEASEITSGTVFFRLYCTATDLCSNKTFKFTEDFVNCVSNPRSRDFFDFLKKSEITFEQYDDLIGLVFDATIAYEQLDGKIFSISTNRQLVAKPPTVLYA